MREVEGTQSRLLVTVEDAAKMLSLGRSLVYQLVMKGEIRSVKIGRSRRIATVELERFVEERLEAEEHFGGTGGPQ